FKTFVLDEVDRMLDMGFINDIKYLISFLPPVRQSLFFSATLSPEINRLIQSFVQNPVTISVKSQDTSKNVEQDIVRVNPSANKIMVLHDLLKKDDFKKVLIFGRTKMGVERLATGLFQEGFKVTSIHGDKPQHKRAQAIRLFKENVVNILVATDVAARGIDIADITHVINFDQPATYDDYVHRIGRTGRGNSKGTALTFV
ncbi:MAG: DEAD/DEAH box helicase, partial [Patescibacteria group bacterium]